MSIPSRPAPSQKSKLAVWLLAFFFGTLGVHNFYLGEKREGVYHLVLMALYLVLLYTVGGVAPTVVNLGNWAWGLFQAYKASQRPDVV